MSKSRVGFLVWLVPEKREKNNLLSSFLQINKNQIILTLGV